MARYIDADALLKKFDDAGIQITFDLPVEEILGEEVDLDDFTMLVQDAIQAYRKMAIDTIKNQPTAYDVDAVVAELENGKMWKEFMIYDLTHREREIIGKAIEIVRKGGVG